jgi:hypothetical protein
LTDTAAAGWEMASAVLILESNPKYDYAGWLPVDHYGWVEIITDGEHMWAETGN